MKFDENFVFPVYISQEVLHQIIKICKKNKFEVFGFLVGKLHQWKQQNYIIIEDFVYIKEALIGRTGSVYEIGDTPFSGEINKYIKGLYKKLSRNEDWLNLGWWHSHPNHGLFLSSDDILTQQAIYYKPYHVALVVDPIRDEMAFFTLDNKSNKGYKELSFATIT